MTQECWSRAPQSTGVDLAMAIAQICFLEPNPPMPSLARLSVERRIAPPPRRWPRNLLGEPPWPPDRARVLILSVTARGRRWPMAVDVDLIRRPESPHTPSVHRRHRQPWPAVSASRRYSRAPCQVGQARRPTTPIGPLTIHRVHRNSAQWVFFELPPGN
jgi:hypothetical protein